MTFTVIARDEKEGLLGIAQSTNPLSVGGRCPFIRSNVAAVSSQAYTDPGLGPLAIELLSLGHSPDKVLKEIGESDNGFEWRQIGIVDRHGRSAVHTGSSVKPSKGSVAGLNYLVMGNYLASDEVVANMDKAWHDSKGSPVLESRLLAVVKAGRDAGGDMGGHRSACLVVYGTEPYARTDLRVDFVPKSAEGPDAVDALAVLAEKWIPMIPYYLVRPHNPSMIGWQEWLAEQGTPFTE